MENVVETVSELSRIDRADARLALMLVLDVMREVVSDDDAWVIADALPPDLGYLLQPVRRDEPAEVRDFVPQAHIETVCLVLAAIGPDELAGFLADEVPGRIATYLASGGRPDRTPSSRSLVPSMPTIQVDTRARWAAGHAAIWH